MRLNVGTRFVVEISNQFDQVALSDLRRFESNLLDYVKQEHPVILSQLERTGELTDESLGAISKIVSGFRQMWMDKGSSG